MDKSFLKSSLGWGFLLWFVGYALGFAFFAVVPPALIGWFVTPFGVLLTVFVAARRIPVRSLGYYAAVAAVWLAVAVVCDYLFLVLLLKPADGYYKLDVYLYYALTVAIPVAVGWWKLRRAAKPSAPLQA